MKLNCSIMLYWMNCERIGAEILRSQSILFPVLLRCTMMLWHMGPRQSLSEVVGTHVVLACKWIITVFYTQHRSPPPPPTPINVASTKNIKPDEKWDTTLNRGRGDCRLLKFKGFVASVPRLLKLIVGRLLWQKNVPRKRFSLSMSWN
jgi:hypothetical protein